MRPLSQRAIQASSSSSRRVTGRRNGSTSASSSKAQAYDYATTFDSRYIARYRDPAQHDLAPLPRRFGRTPTSQFSLPSSISLNAAPVNASTAGTTLYTASASHGLPTPNVQFVPRRPKAEPESSRSKDRSREVKKQSADRKGKAKETALLFPGSGSQYVGMNTALDKYRTARETWDEAEEALAGFEKWRKDLNLHELPELEHLDLMSWPTWQKERAKEELRQIVAEGPQDELTRSSNAQPAITITSIALLRVLEREYGIPVSQTASHFAGHSSGEYSACVAAGVISFAEGVRLTRLHGLLTSRTLQLSDLKSYSEYDATDEERAQMSALVLQHGKSIDDVKDVLKRTRQKYQGNTGMVEIASYNSSTQLVLSGSRAGVLRACERLEEKQIAARAADLPVFAPFHCSFMSLAETGMRHAWEHGVSAKAPRRPIVSNLNAGLITDAETLKNDIVASVHKPVLWSQALDVMRDRGVERYVYIGPGKALANLAKKECKTGNWKGWKELEIASVAGPKDFEDTAEICEDLIPASQPKQASI